MKAFFSIQNKDLEFCKEITILEAMQQLEIPCNAPCGGQGKCGKCRVLANGKEVLACQTMLQDGMQIVTAPKENSVVLTTGASSVISMTPVETAAFHVSVDIGTTTVVCQILSGQTGAVLATAGALNAQEGFGADVVSRIREAEAGKLPALTKAIRTQLEALILEAAAKAGADPDKIGVIGIVGNTCMQQLFLGLSTENLVTPPFPVKLTKAALIPSAPIFSQIPNGKILIVPDIFGYIGGDTIGCILSTGMSHQDALSLMVDIGTNGEMVLGNRSRMVACATAAGPALEGAGIRFGMRGAPGAIDHVALENGKVICHVIGEGTAVGFCGSGLIDAVAMLLNEQVINRRGRLQTAETCPAFADNLRPVGEERAFYFTEDIYLTQEDIRQVQMSKGAIAAGIDLMTKQLNISLSQIHKVYLAGAFGSFIRKESACAIGLLPPELLDRISSVGNAALEGCRKMVCEEAAFRESEELARNVQALDLATIDGFSRCFAKHAGF